MRFALERISDPEIEPVSAAEFVRNAGEFQDAATERADDISRVITAAREWVEDHTGKVLVDQTWRLTLTDQPAYDAIVGPANGYYCGDWYGRGGEIMLRRSPAIAITSFSSVDAAGAETVIDDDTYELREADTKWPKLVGVNGATWTFPGTYRIVFRAGYADRDVSPAQDASAIPARFRQAILLYAQALYDSADDKTAAAMMDAAEGLLRGERCGLDFA